MYVLEGLFTRYARPLGGEFWLRLPGIFAGVCATFLFGMFISKVAGRMGGLLATCGVAALPEFIDYYTGARGYGWLILLAVIQWHACVQLVAGCRPNLAACVLIAASISGVLINPMHTLWTGCLLAALAITVFRGGARLRSPRATATLLSIFLVVAGHALWLGTWRVGMRIAHTGTASTLSLPFNLQVALKKARDNSTALVLLGSNAVLTIGLLKIPRPAARFQAIVSMVAIVGGALLLVILSGKFFAASRYFNALYLCAFISAAFLLQRAAVYAAVHVRRRAVDRMFLICGLLAVVLQLPFAHHRARTPINNWWDAADFLRRYTAPGDFVLTGPNSEFEVYRVYALAAGVKAQAPLLVEDALRVQHRLDRADGLALLLQRGKTIWFATTALGQHRTAEYWTLVKQRFQPVVRAPGRADVLIMKSKPAT
jgi:hypothetical protein